MSEYEYVCPACDHFQSVQHPMNAQPLVICSKCHGEMKKAIVCPNLGRGAVPTRNLAKI